MLPIHLITPHQRPMRWPVDEVIHCLIRGPLPRPQPSRRDGPFKPDSHSKVLQVFQGYIFGENPPGESNPRWETEP